MNAQGTTVLVEENVELALDIADRACVLDQARWSVTPPRASGWPTTRSRSVIAQCDPALSHCSAEGGSARASGQKTGFRS